MAESLERREYLIERISRRGEAVAWVATLLAFGGVVILLASGNPPGWLLPTAGFLLAAVAASISLGNWMDRRTRLFLEPGGISYTNGLRRVHLEWGQIGELRVLPAQWGRKVQVFGERAGGEGVYFAFTTLGEVKVQGRTMGRVGFAEGDYILQTILERAGLSLARTEAIDHQGSCEYYSRD